MLRDRLLAVLFLVAAMAAIGIVAACNDGNAKSVFLPLQPAPQGAIRLAFLGSHKSGIFDGSGSEIVAFDPGTKRAFTTNVKEHAIDVLDLSDPAAPTRIAQIDVTPWGAAANSVDVRRAPSTGGGAAVVVAAIEASPKTGRGRAVFFDAATLAHLADVQVGCLPDMVTFTPDGTKVITADEGEPNDAYTIDPEGSISVIDVSGGIATLTDANVRTAGFGAFDAAALRAQGVRIFGPNATAAQDLEPEYVAVAPDSSTAWVTLQENNAIAIVDLAGAKVTKIVALGFKQHALAGNGLDASDKDKAIFLGTWPVLGMYQPDAIKAFAAGGATWLVTANEGDARTWGGFDEETRVMDETLDAGAFPGTGFYDKPATLKLPETVGRLKISKPTSNVDGDGDIDRLCAFGGRSFSVLDQDGALVWDSGDQLEAIVAAREPAHFDCDSLSNTKDDRADNKGPEPESVELARIDGRTYVFIGLERQGSIVVYDVSNPRAPAFVDYASHRDFSKTPGPGVDAGDLAPEGLRFVAAADSPLGVPLLLVANEVSGTTSIWRIDVLAH